VKQQSRRNTMLSSHIENGDSRLRGFLHDSQLVIDGMPSKTLDARINLNSFCIRRHSRMTRLTPSSYLRQTCPVEMGAAPGREGMPNQGRKSQLITGYCRPPLARSTAKD
jgi:hypothetical protein